MKTTTATLITTASLALLLASSPCSAQFNLALTVQSTGQNTKTTCGAGSAQMMMMGYPNVADNACFRQNQIYSRIQAHKTDTGFYSDPDGLLGAVMELNPPPNPGKYVIFSSTDRSSVMHDMLYWMARRDYPSATLIWAGDHWVVITGFQTDVDPRTGSAVLQFIDINDPAPHDNSPHDNPCTGADEGNEGGSTRRVTGSSFYANEWKNANKYGTTWKNEWIAVVEPPEREGWIDAPEQPIYGTPIPGDLALELSLQHTWDLRLEEDERFRFFARTRPAAAMLSNSAEQGYYLIPFCEEDGACPGAVLLNAYTGEFQEVAAFGQPLALLVEEQAVYLALRSIRAQPDFAPSAELVWQSSMQTRSRYQPLWKITMQVEDVEVVRFITQTGEVHTQIDPLPIGGD